MSDRSVWEKKLSDVFTLLEYPPTLDRPDCKIICGQEPKTISLFFQNWGVDRDTITARQCSIVLQAVIEVGIVNEIAEFTFEDALKWAVD